MKKNVLIRSFKFLLVIVTMLLFCVMASGCWDSKDINEKLIATAFAFDVKDGEIIFYPFDLER